MTRQQGRDKFTVRLSAIEKRQLMAYADERGTSGSEALRDFIKLTERSGTTDPATLVRDALLQQGATQTYFLPRDRKGLMADLLLAIQNAKSIWAMNFCYTNIQVDRALHDALRRGCSLKMLVDNSQAQSSDGTYLNDECQRLYSLAQAGASILVGGSTVSNWNGIPYILHQKAWLLDDGQQFPLFFRGSWNCTQIGALEGNIVDASRSNAIADQFKSQYADFEAAALKSFPSQPFRKNP